MVHFFSYFKFILAASVLSGLLGLVFVWLMPIGRTFKAGVSTILMVAIYSCYHRSAEEMFRIMSTIGRAYDTVGFFKFFKAYKDILEYPFTQNSGIDFLLCLAVGTFPMIASHGIAKRYFRNQSNLANLVFGLCLFLSIYATMGISILILFMISIINHKNTDIVTKILTGSDAISDMAQGIFMINLKLIFYEKDGIYIHENIRIPKSFESRGIIIFGAPGSGKSHLIKNHFIPQIRSRGDRAIIYDFKGEFTESIGEEKDVLIVSPLDARSGIWNISEDIDTEAKAGEFCAELVQDGDSKHDPIFEKWSRDLLTAGMVRLQAENGSFTFADFYHSCQDLDWLIAAVKKYRKEAEMAANFSGDSKQFEAITGTIRAAMVRLEPLVRAWANPTSSRLFSLSDWIRNTDPGKKILIIRDDPIYKETMGSFTSIFFNFAITQVLSLPDAKGVYRDRRISFIIDEFQLLPKIPSLFDGLRAGRSKGMRFILGTQDLGRVNLMYRKEGSSDTLLNLVGFKLIGHLGSQGMQEFAAGLIGKNQISIEKKSVSYSGSKATVSYQKSIELKDAISPGEFGNIPLPTATNGSFFWLVHQGWNPVKLRYLVNTTADKYVAKVDEAWLSDSDRSWYKEAAKIVEDRSKIDQAIDSDSKQPSPKELTKVRTAESSEESDKDNENSKSKSKDLSKGLDTL